MKTAIIIIVSLVTGAYFNQLVLNAAELTCKAGAECIVGLAKMVLQLFA
jgi:hypothetical protein